MTARSDIRSALLDNLRNIVRDVPEEVHDTDSLVADFGADSLQVVEVVSRTMRQLRIRVRRTELSKARNIGDLVGLLESAARRAA